MRGRAPRPTKLKTLMGVPTRERLNYAEPVTAINIADPPEWMNTEQRAEWQLIRAAAPSGLWKALDQPLLAAFVCAAVTYRHAAVALSCERSLLTAKASRYMNIRNKEAATLKRLATELGLSPASRPRMQVTPEPDAKTSAFEKLLG